MKKQKEASHLAVDELEITRALRVAVASAVLGASLVAWVLCHPTVRVHLGEVQSAVETAGELGNVDVEGELLVQQLEHVVARVRLHQVDTGPDVLVGAGGHKVELERGAGSGDTVGTSVVGTVQSTVLRARGRRCADGSVPLVTGVAVGVAAGGEMISQRYDSRSARKHLRGGVEPAPVGIENDLAVDVGAGTRRRACLPVQRRVNFCCLGSCLLGICHSDSCKCNKG